MQESFSWWWESQFFGCQLADLWIGGKYLSTSQWQLRPTQLRGLFSSKILHLFIFWPFTVVLMLYFWPILERFTTLDFLFFTSLKVACLKLNSSFLPVWFLSQFNFNHFPDNSDLWKVADSNVAGFLEAWQPNLLSSL